jgi:hypothetical protein
MSPFRLPCPRLQDLVVIVSLFVFFVPLSVCLLCSIVQLKISKKATIVLILIYNITCYIMQGKEHRKGKKVGSNMLSYDSCTLLAVMYLLVVICIYDLKSYILIL